MAVCAQQTLVLRDGTTLNGRMVEGGESYITFRTDNGENRRFDIDRVQSINFNGWRQDANQAYGSQRGQYGANSPDYLGSSRYSDNRGRDYGNQNNSYGNGYGAMVVPAGAEISVRTNEVIDARNSPDNRSYSAVVDRDVVDTNGNVIIPRGADARLVVRNAGNNQLALDLESVMIHGQNYAVDTSASVQHGQGREGVGENRRTAEYVGGGTVLGTLLGAIAGGGKGAAIGALAGAAAGAGTQVLTRGDQIHVPAETVLNFRLNNDLRLQPAR
jgi:hypothetical protein